MHPRCKPSTTPKPSRHAPVVVWLALCGLMMLTARAGAAPPVPLLNDLQAAAREADEREIPILLSFSAHYCGYCDLLEEEFLQPMLISGDYEDKVLIGKILIDDEQRIRDFTGVSTSGPELADRYRIDLTPTLVLLDGRGDELTHRLVGLTTLDFFGGYLDNAIDEALAKRRAQP